MMLDPFTFEEAVYLACEGAYLIRRSRAIGRRTAQNWPAHDELLLEGLWFEWWVLTHELVRNP